MKEVEIAKTFIISKEQSWRIQNRSKQTSSRSFPTFVIKAFKKKRRIILWKLYKQTTNSTDTSSMLTQKINVIFVGLSLIDGLSW